MPTDDFHRAASIWQAQGFWLLFILGGMPANYFRGGMPVNEWVNLM